MALLAQTEIQSAVDKLEGWTYSDNAIHKTAIINNSFLTHCTVSENCHVEGSKLINVIMLPGSKVLHQTIDNTIVGHDKVIDSKRVETIKN